MNGGYSVHLSCSIDNVFGWLHIPFMLIHISMPSVIRSCEQSWKWEKRTWKTFSWMCPNIGNESTYPSSFDLRRQHDHHGRALFPRHLPEVGASVGQWALARYVAVNQAGGRNLHLRDARHTQQRATLCDATLHFFQSKQWHHEADCSLNEATWTFHSVRKIRALGWFLL